MPVRLTESYLRKIIKEEASKILNENDENLARNRIAYDVLVKKWEVRIVQNPKTGVDGPALKGEIISTKTGNTINYVYTPLSDFKLVKKLSDNEIYLQHIGPTDMEKPNRIFLLQEPLDQNQVGNLDRGFQK